MWLSLLLLLVAVAVASRRCCCGGVSLFVGFCAVIVVVVGVLLLVVMGAADVCVAIPTAPPFCQLGGYPDAHPGCLVILGYAPVPCWYHPSITLASTFQFLDKPWSQVSSLLHPGSCV